MKILIAGDFCDNGRVSPIVMSGKYSDLLDDVRSLTADADYSILNFETAIASENDRPILKNGPHLKGDGRAVDAVCYAGFNCATLANNHILDYGEQCGLNTMHSLQKAGIDTVGFGENEERAEEVLYRTVCGKTLAVINCCEHEFSVASPENAGACGLDPVKQFRAIKEARKTADYVLIIVHGGIEHFNLPTTRMKELYHFFIDAGADAVVNHHQHCFCGYEMFRDKPIFYGLGNLLFDFEGKRNSEWNIGAIITLDFKENITFNIHPFSQCNDYPSVSLLKNEDLLQFNKKTDEINGIISDSASLEKAFEEFAERNEKAYWDVLKPCGKIAAALYKRGLFKGYSNLRQSLALENFILCESHRDRFLSVIKKSRRQFKYR